jgi:diguanylate cyclase (GGDEF)-like protein/PAS domain S-box-containing protein
MMLMNPIGVFASVDAGLGVSWDVIRQIGVPTIQLHAPHRETRTDETATRLWEQLGEMGVELTAVFGGFEGESYADIPTVERTIGLVPPETRDERLKEMFEISDFTRKLRCDTVALHLGVVPDDPEHPERDAIIEVTRRLCRHCASNEQFLHLETGQETADGLIAFIDDVGTIVWVSRSVERFFGRAPDDLVGQRFDVLVAPESLPPLLEAFTHIGDAYEPGAWGGVGVPVDILRPDGTRATCEVAAITRRRTGLSWYVVVIRPAGYERALDRTVAGMASAVSLGDVLARVATAIENMVPGSGVAIGEGWTGERFAVSTGNAASLLVDQPGSPWSRALATQEDQWLDDLDELPPPLAALARAEGYAACWVHVVSAALEEDAAAAVIVWRRHPGRPSRFTWAAVERAGQLLGLALQWNRGHTGLAFAANHDPLTGLANRQAFRHRLETVAAAQIQAGAAPRATVFYFDLDRFKPINDHLGHLIGDQVLEVVARRLTSVLRPGDLAARMGGDEFAVLCERLGSRHDAEQVASRLLTTLQEPMAVGGHTNIRVDASIGLSEIWGGEPADTVVASADDAMRAAKHAGRGHWRWFTPADTP